MLGDIGTRFACIPSKSKAIRAHSFVIVSRTERSLLSISQNRRGFANL
jgi:hypothetical protein